MIKKWLKNLPSPVRIPLSKFKACLGEDLLNVVDVGATGGPEARWEALLPLCHFYTFDPDARALIKKAHSTHYPIALWSSRGTQELSLTHFPPASTLFPFNPKLDQFATFDAHRILKTQQIQVDRLDSILTTSPDFIKVDAEGAELEILKGSHPFLETSCLGLQLEVSFFERHLNAPRLSDLTAYLRPLGFEIVQLSRAHWTRRNRFFPFVSAPQLIWGNALFLLTPDRFLERLKTVPNPSSLLAKYLLILLSYRMFDTALEVCDKADPAFKKLVLESAPSNLSYTLRLLLALLIGISGVCLFFPLKKLRTSFRFYLSERLRQLGALFTHLGAPDSTSLNDYE